MVEENYQIEDRETGSAIDCFETFNAALDMLKEYEEQDRIEGKFVQDFYKILNLETEEYEY